MTTRHGRPASRLPGVRYGSIERLGDARGSFREIWREDTFGPMEPADAGAQPGDVPRFVQANLSTSAPGVLRGLHLHRRQLDHWLVVSGRAFVALVDVRPMLGGGDRPQVETRELGPDESVDIPTGVAHGFLALEDLELVYLVTNAYDGSDEWGFAWDDPLAAVEWPTVQDVPDGLPILSERDRSNPSLRVLVERLRTTA
ncbi:MAG: dTDP-4-dehydrorhamnose 3,5-epimerase family protein [Candidatus Limnocylindrales bacterium]